MKSLELIPTKNFSETILKKTKIITGSPINYRKRLTDKNVESESSQNQSPIHTIIAKAQLVRNDSLSQSTNAISRLNSGLEDSPATIITPNLITGTTTSFDNRISTLFTLPKLTSPNHENIKMRRKSIANVIEVIFKFIN